MANQANVVQNDIARATYLVDANGNPISVTNPLGVNASFSASSISINDPTTTTNKATVDVSGNLHVSAVGSGTAGTPTGGVLSIQGVSGGQAVPITGTISATNPSVSTDGAAIPASSTLIGASDGTNLQPLLVESSSNRNLRTGIYSGANEAAVTGANALKVDGSAVTQPISGTVTANDQQADLTATGTISAAQPVIGTPVSNATVTLAVGLGQSSFRALLAAGGGGFTSGTTIVVDKSPDGGTTWFTSGFKVAGSLQTTTVQSVGGPGPIEISGNAASTSHVRVRCSVLNSTETVAVTLRAGVGVGDVGIISSIPTGSNTIGNVGLVAGSAVIGSTTIQATSGTSLSADQSNTELRVSLYGKNSTAGDTAIAVDSGGHVIIAQPTSATGTITSVGSATSSTSLLASNSSRKGAYFYNDSTAILYLALAASASTTAYTVQVPANGFFEIPVSPVYTGAISGVWSAVNGSARITEMS